MKYVNYGKTGLKVSRFGLGCMRFPDNEAEAIEMVRYALDHGVNYIDTAYVYQGSENITGKSLKDGYRNKTYLATKSPIWNITTYNDFEKYLDEQLKRLQTDYIDVYLLHNLGFDNWQKVKRFDGLTFLDKMVKKGKIRHTAFSYHGPLELFKEVTESYDWEMAQIQLNILDEFYQVGTQGLKYLAEKGIAAVIMEPLKGGSIVNQYPPEVKGILSNYPEKRTLVEWCFRWLYNMPEVSVVISGTSTLAQLKENLDIFHKAECNVMTTEDLNLINRIREAFEKKKGIDCTGCSYCMPCPKNVNIPEIFKLYNSVSMTDSFIDGWTYKSSIISSGAGADQCINCGLCMTYCPQNIVIPENLKKAHSLLLK
ncbi:aldo/keto reductase [Aminipila terrae]|uniref:Aldo/keto reductase n=1 Tax=Aminipila terrae TaxID=2697030 RepID=A0A6P1MNN1_9FIRM|nr:aldo/keto reductase [Aminipila terrae]QHI73708.1 aldo/keto reductase [Aminipila terrae]